MGINYTAYILYIMLLSDKDIITSVLAALIIIIIIITTFISHVINVHNPTRYNDHI